MMSRNILKCIFLQNLFIVNIVCAKSLTDLFKMTTSDMIREQGYKAEEHTVTTEDGYLLTMHRIPGKTGSPAIFLQHGLLSNSFDFVIMGKNKSIAFILADHGYDVWLGNARGNTYSRRHVCLDPSIPNFWNFSFHEMGIYDLPAVITYIADLKNDSIIYVGHSMGTTMSYIMAIERPDIAEKVKVIFSFAPAVFFKFTKTPMRLLTDRSLDVEGFISDLNVHELLPQSPFTRIVLKYYCNNLSENNLCLQFLSTIFGYNLSQFDFNLIPMIFSHTPSGTSVKTAVHFIQLAKVGKFQKFDYKLSGNKIKYNRTEPPEYDITKIKVPVGLFWSDNDLTIHPKDVQTLYDAIPNKVLSYRIPDPLFTHLDFLWAKNAPEMLYSKLLSVMENYL